MYETINQTPLKKEEMSVRKSMKNDKFAAAKNSSQLFGIIGGHDNLKVILDKNEKSGKKIGLCKTPRNNVLDQDGDNANDENYRSKSKACPGNRNHSTFNLINGIEK